MVGFKPSTGAIANGRAVSHTNVLGLLAADPDTVALAFAVLRGADPIDPVSVDFSADTRSLEGIRVGWAPTLGLADVRLDPARGGRRRPGRRTPLRRGRDGRDGRDGCA